MLSMPAGRLAVASVAPDPQPGVPHQRIETAVVVQQHAVVLDAKARQQDLDGAAHGAATGAQAPVVSRRTNGLVVAPASITMFVRMMYVDLRNHAHGTP
jgi:hypothetical protein